MCIVKIYFIACCAYPINYTLELTLHFQSSVERNFLGNIPVVFFFYTGRYEFFRFLVCMQSD